MRRRGVTFIEVTIAAVLLLYAAFVFLSVYSTTVRFEVHSQNRTLAAVLGENLLDEMEGHLFGTAPPKEWNLPSGATAGGWREVQIPAVVEGRPVQATFHLRILFRNGSFIGRGTQRETWDLFTGVISWREGLKARDTSGEFAREYYQDDNVHLVVQIPVWR